MKKTKKLKFTEEQNQAITAVAEFATEMFSSSWYFVFTGPAGSGKSSCMMEVQSRMRNLSLKCEFTAPTNKAAKVLRRVVGKAATTYSFLNLRVTNDGAVKKIAQGKDPDLSHLDILVVDEASMVNKELFEYLKEAAARWGFKVVFMGDPYQLPPVGEVESKALKGKSSAHLNTVMRHDNQILTFATHVREQIGKEKGRIKLLNDNDGEEGVWIVDPADFKEMIFLAAQEGHFTDGDTAKVIAWRNVQVEHYNNIIRIGIFGKEARPGYFLMKERITVGSPCMWGEIPLMHTDEGGVIVGIEEKRHPYYNDFFIHEVSVQKDDDDKVVKLASIHPGSKEAFEDYLNDLSSKAKRNPKLWKDFWETKDYFHDVRYGYAETAHKSQGSTYRDVYVDSGDIMRNKNIEESYRCLYVASTRPTTRLTIV
jgi:hypothetical protein